MERNVSNPINDNLMRIACPGSHSQAPTAAKITRRKDDSAATLPDDRRPAMSMIDLFVAARTALIQWRRRRRTYDTLMALDDRSLADIGMHRSQVPEIVEAMCQGAELHPDAALAFSPRAPRLVTSHR
jgi:uncharacterized protein YjiS (DUF1127 family)